MQGVKHFKDIRYTATLTYGEMLLQNEYEMSCYNLDNAHVPSQQQLFELHKKVRTLQASPCFVPMCQRIQVHVKNVVAKVQEVFLLCVLDMQGLCLCSFFPTPALHSRPSADGAGLLSMLSAMNRLTSTGGGVIECVPGNLRCLVLRCTI